MSELVPKIREIAGYYEDDCKLRELLWSCVSEIEQLQAECLRLQADLGHGDERVKLRSELDAAREAARFVWRYCRNGLLTNCQVAAHRWPWLAEDQP